MSFEVRRLAGSARRAARRNVARVRRRIGRAIGRATSQSRAPEAPAPELVDLAASAQEREITNFRGRFVVSRLQPDVTVWRLAADTATAVADALDQAGVEFFAMHPPYTRVARWGVRRDQFPAAIQAIGQALGEQAYYVHDGARNHLPRLVAEGLDPDQHESLNGVTVFQYVRCTTTEKLYGAPDGCRIAVWDQSPIRATLLSPDRGSPVQEIEDQRPLTLASRRRWDGWDEPIVPCTAGDAAAIEYPIDAVYLWVDDSDPAWQKKRAAVRARLGLDSSLEQAGTALASHQFRDRGELRASMRSLEMYAPWLRHIYLVTDDQRPDWLDTQHGRVEVVDHTEIFADRDALPTYNSHAIGSQVHRIPGLSDRYLLMNDDVMFNSPVTPYDFFTPTGQLKISFSRGRHPDIPREQQSPLEQARTNSAELIARDFGRRASELFAHVPIPQRRDLAMEVAQRYSEEITATMHSPFRSTTDVITNSWLQQYIALFSGRGIRSTMRFGYYNTGNPQVRERLERSAPDASLKVFCLNDVPPADGEEDADPEWVAGWLGRRFPVRTPFERVPVEEPVAVTGPDASESASFSVRQ